VYVWIKSKLTSLDSTPCFLKNTAVIWAIHLYVDVNTDFKNRILAVTLLYSKC